MSSFLVGTEENLDDLSFPWPWFVPFFGRIIEELTPRKTSWGAPSYRE